MEIEKISPDERRAQKLDLEKFQNALNRLPNMAEVKELNGVKYLPISFTEMTLDELFFGLWETKDFRWQVMGNEVVGSLTLRVFHPVANVWIERTGAAATMIRQTAGAAISDIDKKIKNALEMDFPHLKADCLASAARSFGKVFGRDLNRKIEDSYRPLVHSMLEAGAKAAPSPERLTLLDKIAENLCDMRSQSDCDAYMNQNPEWLKDREILAMFIDRKNQLPK